MQNILDQVREQLIAFVQEHYPESLPRTRVELPTIYTADNEHIKERTANHEEIRASGGAWP